MHRQSHLSSLHQCGEGNVVCLRLRPGENELPRTPGKENKHQRVPRSLLWILGKPLELRLRVFKSHAQSVGEACISIPTEPDAKEAPCMKNSKVMSCQEEKRTFSGSCRRYVATPPLVVLKATDTLVVNDRRKQLAAVRIGI